MEIKLSTMTKISKDKNIDPGHSVLLSIFNQLLRFLDLNEIRLLIQPYG